MSIVPHLEARRRIGQILRTRDTNLKAVWRKGTAGMEGRVFGVTDDADEYE
jgi:hypothetical protein